MSVRDSPAYTASKVGLAAKAGNKFQWDPVLLFICLDLQRLSLVREIFDCLTSLEMQDN